MDVPVERLVFLNAVSLDLLQNVCLNELKIAADSGKIDKMAVQVVVRDKKIVDFLTVDDNPRAGEEVRTMPLLEVLKNIFEL